MMTDRFVSLYTSAQPALQQFVSAHVPNVHEAKDVMQEVAARLWKKFPEFAPGISFLKWAIRMAQYEVLHARRRFVLTPKLSDRAAERYEAADLAQVEAQQRALEHCMEELPEPHRELVAARYDRALGFAEIARKAGGAVDQLRLKLFRIRAILRRCMKGMLQPLGTPPKEALA